MIHATETNVSLMTVETLKSEPIRTYSKISRNIQVLIFTCNLTSQLLSVEKTTKNKAVVRIKTLPLHFVIWP